MRRRPLQWHPAFQAVLQIELSGEAEFLQFFKEYNLTDGPLRADTLIIKKEPDKSIQKNIGRIFWKLFRFLKEFYGARIEKAFPGIYYVDRAVFPTQVIIQKELSGDENIWLSRLRQDLEMEADVPALARAYRGKEENPLYSEAMDLIVNANWELYKEGEKMCNALNELFADKMERERVKGRAEGRTEGKIEGKIEGRTEGRCLSVLALLEDLGQIPSSLRETILSQKDSKVLTDWLKAAAAAANLEDFRKAAKL